MNVHGEEHIIDAQSILDMPLNTWENIALDS